MKRYYFSENQKIVLLSVLSAILLGLPFLKYEYGFVVVFGIIAYIGLLYVLSQQKEFSLLKKIVIAWLPGFVSLLIVVSWLPMANTNQWSGLPTFFRWYLIIFSYFGFAAILSVQYIIVGLLTFGLKLDCKKSLAFLLLPSFWVVGEFTRSVLFSVVLMGPGGSAGPYWNFGALGLAVATTPLGYLARLVGLWGLSFVIVMVSLCIAWLIWHKWKLPAFILTTIFVATILGYFVWQPSNQKISVGFLQYFVPPIEQVDKQKWVEAVAKLADGKPKSDLLVLPEYAGFFNPTNLTPDQSKELLHKFIKEGGIAVDSEDTGGENSKINTLVVASQSGEVLDSYQKTFLIPTGEYVPYVFQLILKTANQSGTLEHLQKMYGVQKGTKPNRLFDVNNLKIAAQVCSGAIAPELFRGQVRAGGQIMTNSAAVAILANAIPYHEQAKQTARFMAVANAKPLVQGSFGTYSYIISSDGRFLEQSNNFDFDYKTDIAAIQNKRTMYANLGEWVVILSFISTLVYGLLHFKHKKFDKQD